jgi:hypothetical protein
MKKLLPRGLDEVGRARTRMTESGEEEARPDSRTKMFWLIS